MRKRSIAIAPALLALGAGIAAFGCESGSAARRAAVPASQPTWETVLPGRAVAEASRGDLSYASTRRDAALALREPHPRTAIDGWPREPRTTLDRQRRLLFSTTDRTFIYYRLERTDVIR